MLDWFPAGSLRAPSLATGFFCAFDKDERQFTFTYADGNKKLHKRQVDVSEAYSIMAMQPFHQQRWSTLTSTQRRTWHVTRGEGKTNKTHYGIHGGPPEDKGIFTVTGLRNLMQEEEKEGDGKPIDPAATVGAAATPNHEEAEEEEEEGDEEPEDPAATEDDEEADEEEEGDEEPEDPAATEDAPATPDRPAPASPGGTNFHDEEAEEEEEEEEDGSEADGDEQAEVLSSQKAGGGDTDDDDVSLANKEELSSPAASDKSQRRRATTRACNTPKEIASSTTKEIASSPPGQDKQFVRACLDTKVVWKDDGQEKDLEQVAAQVPKGAAAVIKKLEAHLLLPVSVAVKQIQPGPNSRAPQPHVVRTIATSIKNYGWEETSRLTIMLAVENQELYAEIACECGLHAQNT